MSHWPSLFSPAGASGSMGTAALAVGAVTQTWKQAEGRFLLHVILVLSALASTLLLLDHLAPEHSLFLLSAYPLAPAVWAGLNLAGAVALIILLAIEARLWTLVFAVAVFFNTALLAAAVF